ncbi:MAG: hypothetical protein ACI4T9_01090 [Prevotella sp.]
MTNDKELHYKRWTAEDDNFLMERYYSERLIDLARHLGCSRSTITHHARRLGLWKGNTAERNRDAIALVEMEHGNLTYKELAQRTGMTVKTVCRYARMCGLRRSNEQWRANLSRKRKELYGRERARITFGLEQRTRLKLGRNKRLNMLRAKLRQLGYIYSEEDPNLLYYPDHLCRRPIREQHGKDMGLRFEPLPSLAVAETDIAESC